MRINIQEFKRQLTQKLPELMATYFPEAKKVPGGWRMGNIRGNKGSSLWVGETGGYKDHAQPDEKGDVITLFEHRLNLDLKALIDRFIPELGLVIQSDDPVPTTFPKKELIPLENSAKAYLSGRGIDPAFCEKLPMYSVKGSDEIAFVHTDEYGNVGMIKYCGIADKNFYSEPNPTPIPFPIQYVVENFDEEYVILTEGQWDCLAILQHGIPALTIPNGTADLEFVKHQWNLIHSFKDIYLAFDPDKAGRECTQKLAPRLEIPPKIVDLPEEVDVNDFIQKQGIEEFKELVKRARPYNPPTIVVAETYAEQAIQYNENNIPYDPLPWDAPFGFREGQYTVYVARTHHGKSNLVRQIIANLAARHNISTAVASFEEGHVEWCSMFLRHIWGNTIPPEREARELLSKIYFADGNETGKPRMSLGELLDRFKYLYKRYGCTHAVIDNLACIDIKREDLANQADSANELRQFCIKNPVHIHIVAHPRKPMSGNNDAPTTYDVRGAAEIVEFSWNLLTLWRNIDKEKKISELREQGAEPDEILRFWNTTPCARLACEKQRTTGRIWTKSLWYQRDIRGYAAGPF